MTQAKEKFLKELKGILNNYSINNFTDDSTAHLDKRQELQLIFRNAEQYRIGALIKKWSKSDDAITDDEIAKTYVGCVLEHFNTVRYGK